MLIARSVIDGTFLGKKAAGEVTIRWLTSGKDMSE